jgi:hypothetical protein
MRLDQIKNFCTQKRKKENQDNSQMERIFASYSTDKEFISRIYIQLKTKQQKEQIIQTINGKIE